MAGRFKIAIRDIRQGLSKFELWTSLAQDDLRQRYRRTIFGLVWLTLSYLIFIVAKIFIFGAINPAPLPWFAAYVTVGFLVWQMVSAFVVDGCTSLINSETWVKGVKLPYSTYFFESVARDIVIFAYSAVVAVAVLLFTGHFPGLVALSSLAGILLIILNGVFLQMLLGVICLRYRDIAQIVQTGMRVLFFLTPLVWTPDQVGPLADFLIWNPFTYYIDIVRAPLVDFELPLMSWLISICLTLLLAVLSVSVFSVFRNRIPYWF
ncbi:ABC transporter permease [Hyphobacterium sp. HN65]|uniref:ABC transporter permease n=1 Tax=Hyphobacterium lacteum TaxID=3116575 RepID=A0ABU7LQE4_9PROT|nr:ABC transporter permease [Hyphobacterium sp. HN65]MEE2525856.1 ABC transporter permease [Hyphobacterium sp. HN65]